MNLNSVLLTIGCVIGILCYFPLISGILKSEIKQNVATWALWISLDFIALISIVLQRGDYAILVIYCSIGTLTTIILLCKKLWSWTWFETMVLTLVIVCMIIWYLSGPRGATISSTIAVCIAGFPQLRDSWKSPDTKSGWIYMGYATANGFAFLGGKAWTVEDRFYPGMCTLIALAIGLVALRKPTQNLELKTARSQ